jgi:Trp operon repressor
MAQDAQDMKKRKKVGLHEVQTFKSVKLGWKIRRQVQQEILQKKLLQCFLKPSERQTCIDRYPEAMQPMIRDFMRKAEEKARIYAP